MTGDYSNTYWDGKGKYTVYYNALSTLVPMSGPVPNPKKNKAFEKLRVAANCYYDLYNNGLCNRASEFRKTFGFGVAKDYQKYGLTQEIIDKTEAKMDEFVLAAHKEQSGY